MTATWYREGPLVEVVHDAISSNVSQSEIVDELAEHRFSDTTRRRVESIVAGTVERCISDAEEAPTPPSEESEDTSRSLPSFTDYSQVKNPGEREASRSEEGPTSKPSQSNDSPRSVSASSSEHGGVGHANDGKLPGSEEASLSQPTQSNDPPRSVPTRYIEYGDVEHLGDREFSRLLGLTFERFGGNMAFPLLDAVDVLWHRQHNTVGVRVVASQSAEKTRDAIDAIATGDTDPPDERSPSRLVVVTVANCDDELAQSASDAGVELCGRRQVARWLRIVQLPPAVYGPLLEEGEQSSFDADSVLDGRPPLPARVEDCDPLDLASSADAVGIEPWTVATDSHNKSVQSDTGSTTPSWESSTDEDSTPEVTPTQGSDTPDFHTQPTEGKYGRLYADPAEDGDFDGIDEWVDGLDEEGES